MARTLRIVNAFFAALFVAMALVSAAFVFAGRDGFTGAADARASIAWTGLFALLAALAFANLRRAGAAGRGSILLNLAAALPLAFGAAAAEGIRFLCAAAALPFALTALLPVASRWAGILLKTKLTRSP
jgi:hypothetical protein